MGSDRLKPLFGRLWIENLSDLISNKLIVSVGLDIPLYEQLDDSTDSDLVGSAELNEFLGIDGSGTTVAIVDSGVWSGHPALGGKVVPKHV